MLADGKTIIICTDFSKHSEDAVIWAVNNLTKAGDRLLLYHTIQEPGQAPGSKPPPEQDDVGMIFNDPTASKTSQIHEARDKMNGVMARVQKMVEEMDDVSVEALIEFGDPAESVLAKTKAIRPKFVVVGTRGTNSSWRGLVMGSTSHAILTQCVDTPVIISRGPKPGRRGSVAQKFTQQASPGLGIKVTLPPKE